MTTQPNLFDYAGLARPTDPETSHEAARRVVTNETCQAIMSYIRRRGELGSTDAETQAALDLPANSQPTRRNQLVKAGFVRDSGLRRKTPKGCSAIVWVATGGYRW